MNSIGKIVVFGGTGHYGRKIVQKLIAKEQSVRVLTRNTESAGKILGEKVELIQGDVTNQETIEASLKGVSCVIISLSAMKRNLIRKMKLIEHDAVLAIMDEAKKAKISRLIYLSGYDIREDVLKKLKISEFGAVKLEIESKIKESDFNWTILGLAPAMDIFFAFAKNGKMVVPGGGYKPIPSISSEDVGEIAAQTALRDDLAGKRIKLTGPEALSFPQVAALISEVTAQEVKHSKIPLTAINIVSFLIKPFIPFVRYLYKSLKLLNNFPTELTNQIPAEHAKLVALFDYQPVTIVDEIKKYYKSE
ncbi:MAG: NAD(P)H-binding protein [Bacteroidales bacterium]|nr:NAD(P)H-binding protein [Bacteroidales bacterium]MBN2818278.1 NAD(P)H-binding protein [Bacteroidales bacterium]